MLSRNFRLQKVGGIEWLQKNYDFSNISFHIDELIVLDVSRIERSLERFCDILKIITKGCFVPIAAGGGVRNLNHARQLLRSGADKIVVNSALFEDPQFVLELAREFGQQCVTGSIDIRKDGEGEHKIYTANGCCLRSGEVQKLLSQLPENSVGELHLNSINHDGTGQGFDFGLLDLLPNNFNLPTILAGGAGHSQHLVDGLLDKRVDAVATAHLFNFVGNGLKKARECVGNQNIPLAQWPALELRGCLVYG